MMTIASLKDQFLSNNLNPADFYRELYPKVLDSKSHHLWIHILDLEDILYQLENLGPVDFKKFPLYGIPFAIKDNIDFMEAPTTAACPDFEYRAEFSATVVEQLMAAGAILVGKTNMDQFATGLVGTRSPYGTAVNALNSQYIPGGSSSGSAVAVAQDLVVFALGTDTAGSGRVPAAMNGIIGLKPSRGVFSCHGVVPACRSLDCVSVFAHSVADCRDVFKICSAQADPSDSYSRELESLPCSLPRSSSKIIVGVPDHQSLEFFNSSSSQQAWEKFVSDLNNRDGFEIQEIDFSPFLESARLLYEGPWVAERYLACRDLIENSPESMMPVTRKIISNGNNFSALDYFSSEYKLKALAREASAILNGIDVIATPTIGRPYTLNEIAEDPVVLNSNLGYYTNFMNLLDMAALAVPAGDLDDNLQFSITLFHHAGSDMWLMKLADQILAGTLLPLPESTTSGPSKVKVAVCGAHLSGFPLNWQLTERGATLVEQTQTAPFYRLFDLNESHLPVKRPGLARVPDNGTSIHVEVWEMPASEFGSFVAAIPPPLGIGKCELLSGEWVSSFICEGYFIDTPGVIDISHHSGWPAYMQHIAQ